MTDRRRVLIRFRSRRMLWCALTVLLPAHVWAQGGAGPTVEARRQAMRTLVQVTASECADGTRRTGTGFALEHAGRVVTAHHVVGGCRNLAVSYEAVSAQAGKLREARTVRVYASGDLALLQVTQPPEVPTLRLAAQLPSRSLGYAGLGYALGMPTATDVEVRFSAGASRLRDILPAEAAEELKRVGSAIATERDVLRFQSALQPGMSGGPIVNAEGEVIGVVAGGLKAGAAPASWGWPGDWVRQLLASTEPLDRAVRIAGTYYTQTELSQWAAARLSGARVRCGGLEFVNTGRRTLAELERGSDDWPRLQHIKTISGESPQALARLAFQVWVHEDSGATALVPDPLQLQPVGEGCAARSASGPFEIVIWGAPARTPPEVQDRSSQFEQRMMGPRAPSPFGYQWDPQLTTVLLDPRSGQPVIDPRNGLPMPGPQLRANQMIFNRKGYSHSLRPPRFPGDVVPYAHSFETLVAKSGTFLGVGTINGMVDPNLMACQGPMLGQPACGPVIAHLRQWTHFILATQMSTYPVF